MDAPDEAQTKELNTYVFSSGTYSDPDRIKAARVEFTANHVVFYDLNDELVSALHARDVAYVYIEKD